MKKTVKSWEPYLMVEGRRVVLTGGKIRFNHCVYQSEELMPYVGEMVIVKRNERSENTNGSIVVKINSFSWMDVKIDKPI